MKYDESVAKATLKSQMSVHPFVHLFVHLKAKQFNSLESSSFIIHLSSFFIHPSSFFILPSFRTFKLFSLFLTASLNDQITFLVYSFDVNLIQHSYFKACILICISRYTFLHFLCSLVSAPPRDDYLVAGRHFLVVVLV